MENKAEAVKAIKWECAECHYVQYGDYSLEYNEETQEISDIISCECCGEDNLVVDNLVVL